ncbi:S-layer homology domain-containing protein [Paenibacillus sp. Root444D2]|uniref:S-layer homology domain-containing protein n=1 Tax=Paenibacillus sp. Root444D2 TaxID=1736538 RepID=UPI00070D9A9E|nr:S-layer homology domain-containing protein [Paenibacillus sp. Root444D2]KQX58712.1 S-layer protein [Paenibacillus sp. Root444D2]
MKKLISTLLMVLLLSFTLLPLAFAEGTDSADTPAVKSVDDFKDLKDLPQDVKDKLDSLIKGGVFNGLTEDTFGLDAEMNRAQFAKVAGIIFKLTIDETLKSSTFTDVRSDDPANSYALPYIEALKKAGLTNGYDAEGKTYKPSGAVSRQELAAFLIRGLGLEEDAKKATPVSDNTVDDWAKGYVALALEKKLMTNQEDGKFSGSKSATRKMLALASYEAKNLVEADATTDPGTPTTKPDTPTTPAGEISAQGKKVVIIGRESVPLPTDDTMVGDRLKALGFRVTYLSERKLTPEKLEGYDLIYISPTINSKYLKGGVMKDVAIPTLYGKNHGMYYLGLSSIEENAEFANGKSISIVDSKHKVASGLSGNVDVFKEADPKRAFGYGIMGKEAKVIATVPGDKTKGTIYYYDKGTKADNGYAVKARISYFFFTGENEEITDDAWKLMDALFLWTLQNG